MGDNWHAHMCALAEQAAAELEGTCKSMHDLGAEFEAATEDRVFCARLDELVFECTQCNWWCSQDECHDDDSGQWVCDDCVD